MFTPKLRITGPRPIVPHNRFSGFTLIELLAAVAIIACLAALSFPALARSRASVKRAQCLSHLHQISLAVHGFAGDHKDFPWQTTDSEEGTKETPLFMASWQLVGNYLDRLEVLQCPADPRPGALRGENTQNTARVSYSLCLESSANLPRTVVATDFNLNASTFDKISTSRASWVAEHGIVHGAKKGNALFSDGSAAKLNDSTLRKALGDSLSDCQTGELSFLLPSILILTMD